MEVDKCKECDKDWEFVALLEGEEDWRKSYTVKLCALHIQNVKKQAIEIWSRKEWLQEDV